MFLINEPQRQQTATFIGCEMHKTLRTNATPTLVSTLPLGNASDFWRGHDYANNPPG